MKTFAECLSLSGAGEFHSAEPFADMDYQRELEIKNKAIQYFFRENLPGSVKPSPLIPAVSPRFYRAVSKRKCAMRGNLPVLLNMDLSVAGASRLEPETHAVLYAFISQTLCKKVFTALARHLNYVVIRGSGKFPALIFNVDVFNAPVVRAAKTFAEQLKKELPETGAFFLYLDESHSDYYLESERPRGSMGTKKLFGPENLSVRTGKFKLMYPPVAFSQVNEPMIPEFTRLAEELLKPEPDAHLADLYCGYGLLGLSMAENVAALTGIELDGPAVDAAAANAHFLFKHRKIRFTRGEISPKLLRDALPQRDPEHPELFILDPPRGGTAEGVIRTIAKREPERILHIICGTDEIPRELDAWEKNGYRAKTIRSIDMFPGTAGMETFILLEPIRLAPQRKKQHEPGRNHPKTR